MTLFQITSQSAPAFPHPNQRVKAENKWSPPRWRCMGAWSEWRRLSFSLERRNCWQSMAHVHGRTLSLTVRNVLKISQKSWSGGCPQCCAPWDYELRGRYVSSTEHLFYWTVYYRSLYRIFLRQGTRCSNRPRYAIKLQAVAASCSNLCRSTSTNTVLAFIVVPHCMPIDAGDRSPWPSATCAGGVSPLIN